MDDLQQMANIENLENAEPPPEPPNRFNNVNPFEVLSDHQFIESFRLSKELVRHLVGLLTPYMRRQNRNTDLPIRTRILVALRFFASGGFQMDIARNIFVAVSQPSASRCIEEVTSALNEAEIFNEWVKFPRNFEELNVVRQKFYEDHNFPGVVGCIDCTHVAIHTPKIEDQQHPAQIYINRKGYHSINVQLICDSNLKIINVLARYPGSTHDAYIWANSNVLQLLQNLHNEGHTGYYLLGDSGYPLRTWLMTPLEIEPLEGTSAYRYNTAQRSTRNTIERCNGVLKMRFRCLCKDRVLHYKPQAACKIIIACVILHNMCIEHNIPLLGNIQLDYVDMGIFNNEGENEEDEMQRVNPELRAGRQNRHRIINNFFR